VTAVYCKAADAWKFLATSENKDKRVRLFWLEEEQIRTADIFARIL
jgi:hypothetical protein